MKKNTSITLDEKLVKDLKKIAKLQGRTFSNLLSVVLAEYAKNYPVQ
jgi:hypothetical protein